MNTDAARANSRGAMFMILAMAAFAVEDTLFKAAAASTSVGVAVAIFGLVGMLGFALLTRRKRQSLWRKAYLGQVLLVRSSFELMGRLFFALALAFAPLSSTSAILQAAPLFVSLGAVLALGEQVSWRRWLSMIFGFCGVLLIIRPGFDSFDHTSLFALLATIGFAGRDLATRASPPDLTSEQLGLLGFAVVLLAGLIIMGFNEPPTAFPSAASLALLTSASVVGILAYSALTLAMRSGDVGFVTPYRYSRLIFALALAVVLFGERPDIPTLVGGAIIICAGLYGFLREHRTGPTA